MVGHVDGLGEDPIGQRWVEAIAVSAAEEDQRPAALAVLEPRLHGQQKPSVAPGGAEDATSRHECPGATREIEQGIGAAGAQELRAQAQRRTEVRVAAAGELRTVERPDGVEQRRAEGRRLLCKPSLPEPTEQLAVVPGQELVADDPGRRVRADPLDDLAHLGVVLGRVHRRRHRVDAVATLQVEVAGIAGQDRDRPRAVVGTDHEVVVLEDEATFREPHLVLPQEGDPKELVGRH